jgi:hypothetical protein
MANPVKNTEYTAQGLTRLVTAFRDKPRIAALLASYLDEIQEIENAAFDIYLDRMLRGGTVTDDIANKIGKMVGQNREGFDTPTYLLLITARIAANRSDGKRETLIRIAKLLIPDTLIFVYQFNPQSLLMIPQGPVPFDPYLIARQFLLPAVAGGEGFMFGWVLQPIASSLMYGYSVANGTTVPTTAQSPGWSGNGGTPIDGGLFGGMITEES